MKFSFRYNRTLLERAVNNFNIQNGAQNQVVSNAIFTHGTLDPLLAHGVVESRVEGSQAILTSRKLLYKQKLRNRTLIGKFEPFFSSRHFGGYVFDFGLRFSWFIGH